jgi:hypothetical protein
VLRAEAVNGDRRLQIEMFGRNVVVEWVTAIVVPLAYAVVVAGND